MATTCRNHQQTNRHFYLMLLLTYFILSCLLRVTASLLQDRQDSDQQADSGERREIRETPDGRVRNPASTLHPPHLQDN